MKETDQEIVNRLVTEQAAVKRRSGLLERLSQRVRGAVVAAPVGADSLPDEVRAFLAAGQTADMVWSMHARRCRRNLEFRLRIAPQDLRGQIKNCACGWPQQRLQEASA